MSKRSEEAALRLYPESSGPMERSIFEDRRVTLACRRACENGYEQAEKDMLDRVCKWLEENATYTHPRTGIKTCVVNLNALREAMK